MADIIRSLRDMKRAGAEFKNCVDCDNYRQVAPNTKGRGYGRCIEGPPQIHPSSRDEALQFIRPSLREGACNSFTPANK